MKKNGKKIIFTIIIIAAIAAAIYFIRIYHSLDKKMVDLPEKEESTVEILDGPTYELTEQVASPEIEKPEVIETSSPEYKNLSDGYLFRIPEGYTLKKSSNVYYLRNSDNSMQIALVITSDDTDVSSLYTSREDYLYRMSGYYDGKEHDLFNHGTSQRQKKELNGKEIVYEETEAWFHNDSDKEIYKTPAYSYYSIFSSSSTDSEEENNAIKGQGIILVVFSSEHSRADVYNTMDEIMESISAYEPTAEELDAPVELVTYNSPDKDGAVIAYPEGWKLTRNSDGMVTIKSTAPDSSPYAGIIIEYLADTDNRIVDDYAQFSGNYEYQILKDYFIQPVGDEAFNYRSVITDTDLHAKIGEKECIRFDITDEVIPVSKSVQYSMMDDSYTVNNIRYTFRSNNVDCMLNFILPNKNGEKLMENILQNCQIN